MSMGSVWYALLLTGAGIVFIQAKTECDEFADYDHLHESPYFNSTYSYLYLKLEEALINDQKTLDKQRAGFISMRENSVVNIDDIQLEVVNGINDTCHGEWSHGKIFCSNSTDSSMWELCHQYGLDMTFSPQSFDVVQAKYDNIKISRNIIWLSLVHGSITSLFSVVNSLEYQSLYWGSAVVTNVFTYGLVLVVARGLSLFMQLLYFPTYMKSI